jgi:hypothetical protein
MAFTWVTPTDQTPLTTKGDLFTFTTVDARLGVGTNGYILSANSATATGLEWIAANPGDITGVTAGTGISGGGTSGDVTVTNSMATAMTTKGDLVPATGSGAFSRLGIGANNTVLTADSAEATGMKWATPAGGGGGKVLQVVQGSYSTSTSVATTTYTDTGLSLSITPTSATSKVLVIVTQYGLISRDNTDQGHGLRILRGATEVFTTGATNGAGYIFNAGSTSIEQGIRVPLTYLDSPATTSATTYKTQGRPLYTTNSGQVNFQHGSIPSVITLMEIGA